MSTFHNLSPLPPEARRSKGRPKGDTWKKVGIAGLAFAILLVGMGLGGANTPDPVETVKEVPGPTVTKTQTVEKKVPVTPAACLEYITLSEEAFGYSAEAMGYMSEAMKAAAVIDVAGVQAASDKLGTVNPKLSALSPKVNSTKAECRAAK